MWTVGDVKALFELAGFLEDFCIVEEDDKTVCGGWNRVYLYPDGTIKCSYKHCNKSFLDVVNELDIKLV